MHGEVKVFIQVKNNNECIFKGIRLKGIIWPKNQNSESEETGIIFNVKP